MKNRVKLLIEYLKIFKRILKAYYMIVFHSKKININKAKKQAYIFLASDYCNLGDIAITYAQKEFLKNNLSDQYEIIEIEVEDTYKMYRSIKKNLNKNSIITLIGGGNTGNLYEFIDQKRRFILRKFKNNIIISFPQTVFYQENGFSNLYRKLFINACKQCEKLTLIAREKNSYTIYREMNTGAKVLLTPDIVFSLNISQNPNIIKDGVALVFRDDQEKNLEYNIEKNIEKELKKLNINYEWRDTCGFEMKNDKYEIMKEYFKMISQKKLIMTDRLHGMILAYINSVPCIVFDNKNHKIRSTVDTWLLNQELIKMCSANDVEVNEKMNYYIKSNKVFNKEEMNQYFEPIVKILQGVDNGKNKKIF